jgi:hypothetical protein
MVKEDDKTERDGIIRLTNWAGTDLKKLLLGKFKEILRGNDR